MTDRPIRIQRSRKRGWRMPAGAIYVGRPTDYGNRYVIGCEIEHVDNSIVTVKDAPHAVALYREWLDWQFKFLPSMRAGIVHDLGGRNLACWCALPKPGQPDHCHASVLIEMANR